MEELTVEELEQALEADLENQELRMTLVRRLMGQGEFHEAAEWVLGASQIVGPEACNQAAWACYGAGRRKEAFALVDDSKESLADTGSPLGFLLLDEIHDALREGRFEAAEELLHRMDQAPESYKPHVCLRYAELRELQGQSEEARYYLEKALKLEPDFPFALFGLAKYHFAAGEFGEAERMILRGMEREAKLELERGNLEARLILGRIRLKQGRVAEARQIAGKLLADLISKSAGLELMAEVQQEIHPLLGAWWRFIHQLEGYEKARWSGWVLALALLLAVVLGIALEFMDALSPYEAWIKGAGMLSYALLFGLGPLARSFIRQEIQAAGGADGSTPVPAPGH